MNIRRRSLRFVAGAVVVSLPLLGMSGVASAKAAKGCHKTHTCKSGTGAGAGTGPPATPAMVVTADPNPVVATSESNVDSVIQVETSPAFAGDPVTISSLQMVETCSTVYISTVQSTGPYFYDNTTYSYDDALTVTLDDDGNVTVEIAGISCAPGSDLIEADMLQAPYDTAVTNLLVDPPAVTAPGVSAFPNPEVETGETTTALAPGGDCECEVPEVFYGSDVYAVFYVETDPVYAEQPVEISDNQLAASCGGSYDWYDSFTNLLTQSPPQETLDDDGNAVFVFFGTSCAPTTTDVVADVMAGTHTTYTSTFTVLAPQTTI